ncbi:MAG: hypothetical protein ACLP0L_26545 [Solirubrobacteraceae bacterium]
MGETPPRVFRRPDGQPYPPGAITKTAYVLKSTDQWLLDVGPDGVIWSGGLGRIKSNQHPARYILDTDGTVLRAPLRGGEDRPVLAGPRSSRSDRRTAAEAIAALDMAGVGPHLYVLGELEVPDGPVKIGLNSGGASRTGRAGLSTGNPRQLEVLHRKFMAFEDLRWTEWIIHKHLTRWRLRGEWFDVRAVKRRYGWEWEWEEFLSRSETGDIPGCKPWRLDSDDHHLVRMRRLTKKEPRQFDAVCVCGVVIKGDPGLGLPSVQERFALEHLRLAPTDAAVVALTRRQ